MKVASCPFLVASSTVSSETISSRRHLDRRCFELLYFYIVHSVKDGDVYIVTATTIAAVVILAVLTGGDQLDENPQWFLIWSCCVRLRGCLPATRRHFVATTGRVKVGDILL